MPAGRPLEPVGDGRPRGMAAHRVAARRVGTESGVQVDSSAASSASIRRAALEDGAVGNEQEPVACHFERYRPTSVVRRGEGGTCVGSTCDQDTRLGEDGFQLTRQAVYHLRMEELRGDRTTWMFDGESVRCLPGRSRDPLPRALNGWELPVSAVVGVDLTTRQRRGRWVLRLRLRDQVDPYAAVGATLATGGTLFQLTGPPKRELLAEYWAGMVRDAASRAEATPRDAARHLVPPVPLHIQTAEGRGAFDGTSVVLTWSGSQATSRKRREQRREYSLAALRAVE